MWAEGRDRVDRYGEKTEGACGARESGSERVNEWRWVRIRPWRGEINVRLGFGGAGSQQGCGGRDIGRLRLRLAEKRRM